MFSYEFECHVKGNCHVFPSTLSKIITATNTFRVLMLGTVWKPLYLHSHKYPYDIRTLLSLFSK